MRSCGLPGKEWNVADSTRLMVDPEHIHRRIDPFATDPDDFWKRLNELIRPDLPKVDPFTGRENMPCMIEQFFENEKKKPFMQRAKACWISCPCPKCNPYCM